MTYDDTLDLPAHPLSSSPLTDMTQELWALGFGCLFASFFKAYPPGGSFSRTALQHEVGVKTPLANVVTSLFVTVSPLGRARTSCVSFPLPFRFFFLFFHDNESNRRSVPVLSPTRIIFENYYLSSSRDGDSDVLLSCDSHACLVFSVLSLFVALVSQMVLVVATSLLEFVPKAVLGAIICTCIMSLFDFHDMWR